MAISLVELVKDFADAAVALDQTTRNSSLAALVEEYIDKAESDDGEVPALTPAVVHLQVSDGRVVGIPTAALRNLGSMQPKRFGLDLTTDAILKGRTLAMKAPQEFFPRKGTVGEPNASNRRVGFMIQGNHLVGGLQTEQLIVAGDESHNLIGFLYYPASGSVMIRCQAHTNYDLFHGMQLRAWKIDGNADQEVILEFDRCQRPSATVGGYVTWDIYSGELDWLVELDDNAEFGISFTDAAHNRMVEEVLGRRVHSSGGTHYDIMVTFTDGLGENTSQLKLSTEFIREPAPEGVERVNDKLNDEIRENLNG